MIYVLLKLLDVNGNGTILSFSGLPIPSILIHGKLQLQVFKQAYLGGSLGSPFGLVTPFVLYLSLPLQGLVMLITFHSPFPVDRLLVFGDHCGPLSIELSWHVFGLVFSPPLGATVLS